MISDHFQSSPSQITCLPPPPNKIIEKQPPLRTPFFGQKGIRIQLKILISYKTVCSTKLKRGPLKRSLLIDFTGITFLSKFAAFKTINFQAALQMILHLQQKVILFRRCDLWDCFLGLVKDNLQHSQEMSLLCLDVFTLQAFIL